ncbi:MAG: hypothetical protein JWQ73_1238 [Variovorax sp.]|nr:hypothetical protein [Variovorax sp.]
MNTLSTFLSQLAQVPLPAVETDPKRVAMLQALQRTGHIRAHFELRDGGTQATVDALTAAGRKMASCLEGGMPSRLSTVFWAHKVREAPPSSSVTVRFAENVRVKFPDQH